ncbi:MAG: hypothetical protein P1V97_31565 [Planctomycetota bacterium]|nr:hypothetical protein [Planctomycetota bacterium]
MGETSFSLLPCLFSTVTHSLDRFAKLVASSVLLVSMVDLYVLVPGNPPRCVSGDSGSVSSGDPCPTEGVSIEVFWIKNPYCLDRSLEDIPDRLNCHRSLRAATVRK